MARTIIIIIALAIGAGCNAPTEPSPLAVAMAKAINETIEESEARDKVDPELDCWTGAYSGLRKDGFSVKEARSIAWDACPEGPPKNECSDIKDPIKYAKCAAARINKGD